MNIISPAVFNSLVAPVGTGIAPSDSEEPETPSATLMDGLESNDGNDPLVNRIETNLRCHVATIRPAAQKLSVFMLFFIKKLSFPAR